MQLGKIAGLELCDQPLRNIFGDALLELAKTNPKVVVLDGDLGNSTKAEYVRQEFPERFFNIGIAESNLVGIGAGLAGAGFYPFIVSFSSFLLCNAYDQIRLALAMSEINATYRGSGLNGRVANIYNNRSFWSRDHACRCQSCTADQGSRFHPFQSSADAIYLS